jgi:hypothetical protein
MLFCKTTPPITAMPHHDINQGSIITILMSIKMITASYRFTSLQCSKSQKSSIFVSNITVIIVPLATHLPASYTTRRDITMLRGAFHTFLSGPNKPGPYLPQYSYSTDFQISPDIGTAD